MTPPRLPAFDPTHGTRLWQAAVLVVALVGGLAAGEYSKLRREPPPAPTAAAAPPAPAAVPRAPAAPHVLRLADFGGRQPSPDVRHVANWSADSRDHAGKAFVVIDKKQARVWVFDAQARLVGDTPALVGAAVGDDAVPGIGEKPLAEVLPEEKTTPAGRYVAEPGVNAGGEDIVWVSYDLAVSMHRVRPTVKAERRLQRLASATPADNRISFGCINLPPAFYEQVLRPTVLQSGAIIYVLPETRTPQQQFGSYDVADPASLASVATSPVKKARSPARTHPWTGVGPSNVRPLASIRAHQNRPAMARGRGDGDAYGLVKKGGAAGRGVLAGGCRGGSAGGAGCEVRARAAVAAGKGTGSLGAAVARRPGPALPGGGQEGGTALRL